MTRLEEMVSHVHKLPAYLERVAPWFKRGEVPDAVENPAQEVALTAEDQAARLAAEE